MVNFRLTSLYGYTFLYISTACIYTLGFFSLSPRLESSPFSLSLSAHLLDFLGSHVSPARTLSFAPCVYTCTHHYKFSYTATAFVLGSRALTSWSIWRVSARSRQQQDISLSLSRAGFARQRGRCVTFEVLLLALHAYRVYTSMHWSVSAICSRIDVLVYTFWTLRGAPCKLEAEIRTFAAAVVMP